ncbi:MAG: CehA/McbA family metallohydrolase [Acidobacteriota bacterium]
MKKVSFLLFLFFIITVTVNSYKEEKPDWSYGKPDKIFDSPWRIPPNQDKMPVLCLLRRGGKFIYLLPRTSDSIHSIKIFQYFPETKALKQIEFFDEKGNLYEEYSGNHTGEWYKIFYVDRKLFKRREGKEIFLKVMYDGEFANSPKDERDLDFVSTYLSDKPLPKLPGWLVGDLHLHSEVTSNSSEYGPPLEIFKHSNEWFELDYVILTDHSYDISKKEWLKLKKFSKENSSDKLSIIIGQEVHAKDDDSIFPSISQCHSMHLLTYGVEKRIKTGSLLLNSYNPTKSDNEVIEEILKKGGFLYIAHPEAEKEGNWNHKANRIKAHYFGNPIIGIEVLNEGDFRLLQNIKAMELYKDFLLKGYKFKVIGNSDSHSLRVGMGRTYVKASVNNKMEILKALREGKTVASDGPFGYLEVINKTGKKAELGEAIEGESFEVEIFWDSNPQHQYTDIKEIKLFLGKVGSEEEKESILDNLDKQRGYQRLKLEKLPKGSYYVRVEFFTFDEKRAVTSPIFVESN